ncbi:GrpB family protein [Alphaproteobacteria bacterium GH1-50]|uniref:GrpB family protein n=1 Tax=Kangsaoukella pontilimi TaxID=2691042 RepID=A0A7C9M9V2_9RHOB|nr:GrpB family protein [Kangsaoukella pontilimi]MXQ07553.1 GrpB family protein [Kangsaoukella pontilimi]
MSLLSPPDPEWPSQAAHEIARWRATVPGLVTVHHIGSTSIPGLPAKPIIDLLPVFTDDAARDDAGGAVQAMGYEWMGAYGLPGRAYCRLIDPETGIRRFHAHGYSQDHPDIRRHLAFRDALRDNAALRAAYTSVKAACAARHPEGGADYGACKSGWIDKAERRALERLT